jgi:hypothetical protein
VAVVQVRSQTLELEAELVVLVVVRLVLMQVRLTLEERETRLQLPHRKETTVETAL